MNLQPIAYKAIALPLRYIGISAGVGSLSDLNPPCGLSQTANVSAALCWMPPEGGAVGEGQGKEDNQPLRL